MQLSFMGIEIVGEVKSALFLLILSDDKIPIFHIPTIGFSRPWKVRSFVSCSLIAMASEIAPHKLGKCFLSWSWILASRKFTLCC